MDGDAVPVFLDHLGKLFVRREVLLAELIAPCVEESAGVFGIGVVPKLLELLAQKIRDIQPRIGLQQAFEVLALIVGQIFAP